MKDEQTNNYPNVFSPVTWSLKYIILCEYYVNIRLSEKFTDPMERVEHNYPTS